MSRVRLPPSLQLLFRLRLLLFRRRLSHLTHLLPPFSPPKRITPAMSHSSFSEGSAGNLFPSSPKSSPLLTFFVSPLRPIRSIDLAPHPSSVPFSSRLNYYSRNPFCPAILPPARVAPREEISAWSIQPLTIFGHLRLSFFPKLLFSFLAPDVLL